MQKKIVHYKKDSDVHIYVGASAVVFPIDHPGPLVSNTKYIQTSTVISYNRATGEFETLNTIYKPK